MISTPTLWHYTCSHGARGIGQRGWLRPLRHPWLGLDVVWLTDLATPDREGLGLTSTTLSCDRTTHRYRVLDDASCVPWDAWVALLVDDGLVSRAAVDDLTRYRRPSHWWVSEFAVRVERDPP